MAWRHNGWVGFTFLAYALVWLTATGCSDKVGPGEKPPQSEPTASIAGTVRVEESPCPSVSVGLGSDLVTQTDAAGKFLFENIPLGTHLIRILSGNPELVFSDSSRTITVSRDGQVASVEFDGTWLRTAVIEVRLRYPYGILPVHISRPVEDSAETDQTLSYGGLAGYRIPGLAIFGGIPAGRYVAHLGPMDGRQVIILQDSVPVEVARWDTASVRLAVAPLVETLGIGQSSTQMPSDLSSGFILPLGAVDTIDVLFTANGAKSGVYSANWAMELYRPWREPSDCFRGPASPWDPYSRTFTEAWLWTMVSGGDTGQLKLLVYLLSPAKSSSRTDQHGKAHLLRPRPSSALDDHCSRSLRPDHTGRSDRGGHGLADQRGLRFTSG